MTKTASFQTILKPELFSKVLEANQMEEIRAAGIEDLVQCPFCSYATIMPPEQKVMVCLNPECLKESCRFVIILISFIILISYHFIHSCK